MTQQLSSAQVREEIQYMVNLELSSRPLENRSQILAAVQAVNKNLWPLFEKRWAPKGSIEDQSWRQRAVERLVAADGQFFDIESRYSSDQPRDDHGRFAASIASGTGDREVAAEQAATKADHEKAMLHHVHQARLHEAAAQSAPTDARRTLHEEAANKHLHAANLHDLAAQSTDKGAGALARAASKDAHRVLKP
jgi:hypothetical protein